jgi:G3E family GTPase
VGIDDSLLQDKFAASEEIFQMNNGCICCTVRGDLIRILRELVKVIHPQRHNLSVAVLTFSSFAKPTAKGQVRLRPHRNHWPRRYPGTPNAGS